MVLSTIWLTAEIYPPGISDSLQFYYFLKNLDSTMAFIIYGVQRIFFATGKRLAEDH